MSGGAHLAITDRAEWLKARRTGCGASDVAGIGGVSPWASPWSVWADKVGLTPLDDDAERDIDDPMTFGRDLEDLIRDRFERKTGLYVCGAQSIHRHPDHSWCFATVDGLVEENEDHGEPLGVFESKYTSDAPWDEIPEHYRWQGHWQMYATQTDRVVFGVLHLPFGRPMFRIYELELNGALLAHIVDTVHAFWFEHVVTGRPPEPDAHPATTRAIAAAWGHDPTEKIPTIDLTDFRGLVDELATLRKQEQVLKWQAERVENGIKHLIGERGAVADGPALSDAYIDGELAVSWRSQEITRVDTKAVRADHGSKYDTKSTTRVLRLHGARKA